MADVFTVYLTRRGSSGDAPHTSLTLPATPYQVLDAFERIGAAHERDVYARIEDYPGMESLGKRMDYLGEIRDMTALAEKISAMNDAQRTALRGLVEMEAKKSDQPLPITRVLDLAYSTECCHVVDACNDEELGRFYAENGFIPGLDDIPDDVFEMLDFEQIGRETRLAEGGMFVERSYDSPGGYVVRHSDLKQAPPVPTSLPRPDYIFRFAIQTFWDQKNTAILDLPASQERLDDALQKLNASSWDEVVFIDYDGAIPELPSVCEWIEGIEELIKLAEALKPVMESGQLPKFKAVLEATRCSSPDVTRLAERLDEYVFSPNLRSERDVALSELRCMLDDETMELLLPHLDAEGFGRAIAENQNAVQTPYGLVERQDGGPIQGPEQQGYEMGVTMQ